MQTTSPNWPTRLLPLLSKSIIGALKMPNLNLEQWDASASVSTEPLFSPQSNTVNWNSSYRHKLVKQAHQQITDPPACPLTQKAAFFLFCSFTAIELHVRGWVSFYLTRIEDAGFLFRGVSRMKGLFYSWFHFWAQSHNSLNMYLIPIYVYIFL